MQGVLGICSLINWGHHVLETEKGHMKRHLKCGCSFNLCSHWPMMDQGGWHKFLEILSEGSAGHLLLLPDGGETLPQIVATDGFLGMQRCPPGGR